MGLTEESVGALLGDRLAVHFDLLGPVLRAEAVGVGALPGLYRQLERECEYLTFDDAVDEAITVNKYTFTAEGAHFS